MTPEQAFDWLSTQTSYHPDCLKFWCVYFWSWIAFEDYKDSIPPPVLDPADAVW